MTGPRPIDDASPGAATSFDLHALLAELEAIISPRAERRGLRLALARDGALPGRIHADRGGLRRLLLVLLGDAVRLARAAIDLRVAVDRKPPRLRGRLAVAGASPDAIVRRDPGDPRPLAEELARQLGGEIRREADGLRLELPVGLAEAAA